MREPELPITTNISDDERNDLEQMMGEFQQAQKPASSNPVTMRQEIDMLKDRMTYLTNMCVSLERSIKPLHEVIRLNIEKCEILNQRINTIIESLRAGESL
ncbi:MAG: hypothetical protein M0036_14870 [Desulfobacteraceae bacterium]|nr:hypothetical protein [Desulfobacteraceae bacterium]